MESPSRSNQNSLLRNAGENLDSIGGEPRMALPSAENCCAAGVPSLTLGVAHKR